jgi:hypothetical protein
MLPEPYGGFARGSQAISPELTNKLNAELADVMHGLERYQIGTVQDYRGGLNPERRAKYRRSMVGPVNIETDIEFTAKVDKHCIHLTFPHESPLVARMHQDPIGHDLYTTLAYNMNLPTTTSKHEAVIQSRSPDGSMKRFCVSHASYGMKKTFHFTADNWFDVTVFLDVLLGSVGVTITDMVENIREGPTRKRPRIED